MHCTHRLAGLVTVTGLASACAESGPAVPTVDTPKAGPQAVADAPQPRNSPVRGVSGRAAGDAARTPPCSGDRPALAVVGR